MVNSKKVMDTKLLHEKINRFAELLKSGKLNIQIAKELVTDLNIWMDAVDKAFGSYEFDQLVDADKLIKKNETIDYLHKALILTGHAEILTISSILDSETFKIAIDFLLDNKDRLNLSNLYQIAVLLELAKAEGKNIKTLAELVNYGRSGI